MNNPCAFCLNQLEDEYGDLYCARAGVLDEDEMARYLTGQTASCPFFEAGDDYTIVRRQN